MPVSAIAGIAVLDADQVAGLRPGPRASAAAGGRSHGIARSSGCGAMANSRRQVLAGEIVGDAPGTRSAASDAGEGAELLLHIARRTARPAPGRGSRGCAPG